MSEWVGVHLYAPTHAAHAVIPPLPPPAPPAVPLVAAPVGATPPPGMVQSCTWRQEAACDALQRAGHAACAWQGHLLVFGGRSGAAFFADLLAYSATRQWTVWCDKWPAAPRR